MTKIDAEKRYGPAIASIAGMGGPTLENIKMLRRNNALWVPEPETVDALIAEIEGQRVEIAQVKRDKMVLYNKGVEDGRSTQAILEIQGRDRFVEGVREETKRLKAEIARLKAMPSEERVRQLRDLVERVVDDDVEKLKPVAEAAEAWTSRGTWEDFKELQRTLKVAGYLPPEPRQEEAQHGN